MPDGTLKNGALKKLYQCQATLMGGAKLEDRIQFAFGRAVRRSQSTRAKAEDPSATPGWRHAMGVRVRELPIRAETLLGVSIPRT